MFSGGSRFLVVDDSTTAREGVRSVLNKIGFSAVDDAVDGRMAVEKLKRAADESKPYDIVFLDLNMPEMDGLKTLETIRQTSAIQNVPVVIITTESAKPTVVRAVMQGISGFIVKPFSADELKRKVVEIFQRVQKDAATR